MVKCIVLLSGKRKSGKDYFSSILVKKFQETYPEISVEEIRISAPLKEIYAKENGLDYQRLLSADSYKEEHREKMIKFGEDKRNEDPGFWCRSATSASTSQIWIVVDNRRETDFAYFTNNFPGIVTTIRIQALEEIRVQRGFKFTNGIDDAPSECGLDNYKPWDYLLDNNDTGNEFELLPEIMNKMNNLATQQ